MERLADIEFTILVDITSVEASARNRSGCEVIASSCCAVIVLHYDTGKSDVTVVLHIIGPGDGLALENVLFGEDATRVLISCDQEQVSRIQEVSGKFGLNALEIGVVTGSNLETSNLRISVDGETVLRESVSALKQSWAESLEKALHVETEEELVPNVLQRS